MVWYPMSTGRSVEEILRLVEALQTTDREAVSTPEGWRHGDAVIEPAPITVDALRDSDPSGDMLDWYYRLRKL
jgi:peroxiredoxin 2/4